MDIRDVFDLGKEIKRDVDDLGFTTKKKLNDTLSLVEKINATLLEQSRTLINQQERINNLTEKLFELKVGERQAERKQQVK